VVGVVGLGFVERKKLRGVVSEEVQERKAE